MSKLRVLVGGGSGFVGRHLTSLLNKSGYDVTLISRATAPKRITWNDIHRNGLPEDVHAVVNLAGQNIMDLSKKWDEEFEKLLTDSRTHTTHQLVQAITESQNPPKVFVSASAVGIYPPHSTVVYDEDYNAKPTDFLTRLTHEWENSAKLPDNSQTRSAIIRIGLVLGRDGGMVNNLIFPFWFGLGGRLGCGSQWMPWVHVDDVAGIIKHVIENDHTSGVYNAVAPEKSTNADFTGEFASALWRPALIPMPEFVLKTVFGKERAAMMLEGQMVHPKRTLESGYEFLYPDLKSACTECGRLLQKMGGLTM